MAHLDKGCWSISLAFISTEVVPREKPTLWHKVILNDSTWSLIHRVSMQDEIVSIWNSLVHTTNVAVATRDDDRTHNKRKTRDDDRKTGKVLGCLAQEMNGMWFSLMLCVTLMSFYRTYLTFRKCTKNRNWYQTTKDMIGHTAFR